MTAATSLGVRVYVGLARIVAVRSFPCKSNFDRKEREHRRHRVRVRARCQSRGRVLQVVPPYEIEGTLTRRAMLENTLPVFAAMDGVQPTKTDGGSQDSTP